MHFKMSSAKSFNLDQSKILLSGYWFMLIPDALWGSVIYFDVILCIVNAAQTSVINSLLIKCGVHLFQKPV